MPEFIIRAEETDLFFLFKDYKELIRCKDCKWHNTDEDECWLSGLDTDGYEYCSWAERKENNDGKTTD